jgi:serine/threonine protein kinase
MGSKTVAIPYAPLQPPAMVIQAEGKCTVPSDFDRKLAGEDDEAPWRKQQKVMLQEMETLRARIAELEADASAGTKSLGGSSSVPSWLQEDTKTRGMSSTLPSRRHETTKDNEALDLQNQLREEQRKSKRLEKDVQRLSDRLSERELAKGAVGSSANFEMSEVELGEIINQGGFSVVHKGYWHSTKVAIKKLFDPKINEELLAEFDNEIAKLEQIRHPNILMLLAVHRKPPALSLITELVEGGSYFQLLHYPHQFHSAGGPVSSVAFNDSIEILEHTAVALTFLHARGIIHRDVKTHNVLLSPHLEVKVCDFGLARMRSELMTGTMQFAGTPQYMSPEQFRQQRYSEKVDVFAYGTLLWEAMAQDIPFANLDVQDIRDKVLNGQMLDIPRSTPPLVQSSIQACWTLSQESRPYMAEVLARIRECREGAMSGASRARRPRTAMPSTGAREQMNSSPLGSSALGASALASSAFGSGVSGRGLAR